MAGLGRARVRAAAARAHEVIRIDAVWLAVEPLDMRAGVDTALARVVSVFGAARSHHAYLFLNRCANRLKVFVHDGFGLWLCARRLQQGHAGSSSNSDRLSLSNLPPAVHTGTSRTCSSGCRLRPPVASRSYYRTPGRRRPHRTNRAVGSPGAYVTKLQTYDEKRS